MLVQMLEHLINWNIDKASLTKTAGESLGITPDALGSQLASEQIQILLFHLWIKLKSYVLALLYNLLQILVVILLQSYLHL